MPASKKRASKKKSSARKTAAAAKTPAVTLQGALPKLRVDFKLDENKIAQIQRCIAKGSLSITLSRVDLAAGRAGDPWLYD